MVLYDFLYIDKNRIDAFYAQIFEGLLKQVEKNTATTHNESEKVEAGIKPFVNGTLSGYKAIQEAKNETIDPEQLVIIDTLSTLAKNARGVDQAAQGDIVKTKGNLHIATNNMLKMFIDVGDMFQSEQPKMSKKELKQIRQLIKSFLDHINIDSIMLLKNNTETIVASLKRECLQEDPDTFQLKYGSDGLDNVFVIGFFESKSKEQETTYHPSDDFISSSKQFAEGIKNLFFPPNSTIVTPIAIYKEIVID